MMDREQNLVFAILAVQLKGVAPETVMAAGAAWTVDTTRSLGEHLVSAGAILDRDRLLLEQLVGESVQAHGGDTARTFAAFGGENQIDKLFPGGLEQANEDDAETLQTPIEFSDRFTIEDVPAVTEAPGRYTRITERGRGGMGRVLLVHDEHLGRNIALKELLVPTAEPDTLDTPVRRALAVRARFLQEARLTGQLEHPSIVPVYELGRRQDGRLYYTMKLVKGKSLFKAIRECKGLAERLALLPHFIDLCNAIAYAHSRGIVHRDIKPDNVMIGEFGETVVLDWGIAKALGRADYHVDQLKANLHQLHLDEESAETKTLHGAVLGTPNYMSPEQADGRIDEVDERSDIYSLGAVLYELLTGKVPFAGGRPALVLKQVLAERPAKVSSLEPDTPPELAAICRKAMGKDPRARYQTAKELAADVLRFQSGAFVKAYNYKVSEALRRYYRRHRAVMNTAMAAVAALLMLGTYSYVSVSHAYVREQAQRQMAERENYVSQMRLVDASMRGNDYALARRTLSATDPAQRNWEWGYCLNRCNLERFTLPDHVDAVYSPDGKRIAAISRHRPVEVFDALTGKRVQTIAGSTEDLLGIRYSPDGTKLMVYSAQGVITVWAAATGKQLARLSGPARGITDAEFDPSGTHIVAGGSDGSVRVWNVASGQVDATLPGHGVVISEVAYSPDGRWILSVGRSSNPAPGEVKVWDPATGTAKLTVPGMLAAWSPDSTRIVVARFTSATVYEAPSGRVVSELTGHTAYIRALHFLPDGTRVVTASEDRTARIYNVATGKVLAKLDAGRPLIEATPSPNGAYILTGSQDGQLKVWSVANGRLLNTLQGHAGWLHSCHFSRDNAHIVSAALDQTVKVWNVANSWGQSTLMAYSTPVRTAALSPDGTLIAIVLANKTLEVRKTSDGALVAAFASYSYSGGTSACFSPDDRRVAVVLDEFTPMVWDLATRKVVSRFSGHQGRVWSVAFSPDGRSVLSTSWDNTARVWDAETGVQRLVLRGHTDTVRCGVFSPDGSRIATGSADKTVRIWDAATGALLFTLRGHTGEVVSLAFSPDGRTLASASYDRSIRLWDTQTGRALRTLEGHEEHALAVAFSPDGTRVASASMDGTVRVWSVKAGREVAQVTGHTSFVNSVAFSPNGRVIISASQDGYVRYWKAVPWQAGALPGSAKMALSKRLALYRKTEPPPPKSRADKTMTVAVATTPAILSDSLERLCSALHGGTGGAASAPSAEKVAPLIASGAVYNALARLCVLHGDELLKINGKRLTANRAPTLLSLAQQAHHDAAEGYSLELRRNGADITFRFVLLSPVERTIQREVKRVDATQLFKLQADLLRRYADNCVEQSQLRAADLGEPSAGRDGLNGFWVPDNPDDHTKPYYLKFGIVPDERILRIEGRRVTSYRTLVQLNNAMLASARLDAGKEIKLEDDRGVFVHDRLRIRVR